MTNEEFSNEFDILINSFADISNTSLLFDEYEKSVFLTQAQETLVLGIYNGSARKDLSFENIEEARRYIDVLVKEHTYNSQDGQPSPNGTIFSLDEKVWFITSETATLGGTDKCVDDKIIEVVPVTQDNFCRTKDNPFKGPNLRRALRLDLEGKVEIVSKYPIKNYTIRYLSKPEPIILTNLDSPLTINGESKYTECKLNSAMHRLILDMAVKFAIASRSIVAKNNV